MKAGEIASLLGLVPLPHEGGYYAETYRSAASTAIYYMLTPDDVSALHRLDADEIYHFYLGDPVEMLVLEPGGGSALVTLGRDIAAGQRVQHVVPRGTWQGSRLAAGGSFALMGTTMAPGFTREGFELGDARALAAAYPSRGDLIGRLARAGAAILVTRGSP